MHPSSVAPAWLPRWAATALAPVRRLFEEPSHLSGGDAPGPVDDGVARPGAGKRRRVMTAPPGDGVAPLTPRAIAEDVTMGGSASDDDGGGSTSSSSLDLCDGSGSGGGAPLPRRIAMTPPPPPSPVDSALERWHETEAECGEALSTWDARLAGLDLQRAGLAVIPLPREGRTLVLPSAPGKSEAIRIGMLLGSSYPFCPTPPTHGSSEAAEAADAAVRELAGVAWGARRAWVVQAVHAADASSTSSAAASAAAGCASVTRRCPPTPPPGDDSEHTLTPARARAAWDVLRGSAHSSGGAGGLSGSASPSTVAAARVAAAEGGAGWALRIASLRRRAHAVALLTLMAAFPREALGEMTLSVAIRLCDAALKAPVARSQRHENPSPTQAATISPLVNLLSSTPSSSFGIGGMDVRSHDEDDEGGEETRDVFPEPTLCMPAEAEAQLLDALGTPTGVAAVCAAAVLIAGKVIESKGYGHGFLQLGRFVVVEPSVTTPGLDLRRAARLHIRSALPALELALLARVDWRTHAPVAPQMLPCLLVVLGEPPTAEAAIVPPCAGGSVTMTASAAAPPPRLSLTIASYAICRTAQLHGLYPCLDAADAAGGALLLARLLIGCDGGGGVWPEEVARLFGSQVGCPPSGVLDAATTAAQALSATQGRWGGAIVASLAHALARMP